MVLWEGGCPLRLLCLVSTRCFVFAHSSKPGSTQHLGMLRTLRQMLKHSINFVADLYSSAGDGSSAPHHSHELRKYLPFSFLQGLFHTSTWFPLYTWPLPRTAMPTYTAKCPSNLHHIRTITVSFLHHTYICTTRSAWLQQMIISTSSTPELAHEILQSPTGN